MVSSVVTARLEYGCGHTALVSLPHIKGERQAQRSQRIAGEKAAAAARACDFCGPLVLVASHDDAHVDGPASPNGGTSLNGAELLDDTSATRETPADTARLPLDGVHSAREATVEAQQPALEEVHPTPLADQPEAVVQPEPQQSEADTTHQASAPATEPRRRTRRSTPRTATRADVPRSPQPAAQRRFRVRFWVETVLDAPSILEAIRVVESRGATAITAVSRER